MRRRNRSVKGGLLESKQAFERSATLGHYISEAPRTLPDFADPLNGHDAPVVSVVIPAFRCAQYISQALDSVLNQSLQNHEVLIVNDGSPDTPELEAALQPYMSKIRYLKQETKGPSGARNTGIFNAKGKYVAFLDGDDYWTPDHLAKSVDILERDRRFVLVYCDCTLFHDSQAPYGRVFAFQEQASRVTFESLLLQTSTISTSSVVALRQPLVSAGGFDETLVRCEDFDMWLRVSLTGGGIAYHSDAEVFHRAHEASLSANGAAMFADRIRVYEKTAKLPLTRQQQKIIRSMIRRTERDACMEQFKLALSREDYAEARKAAQAVNAVESSLKMKIAAVSLQIAPRLFLKAERLRGRYLQARVQARTTPGALAGEKRS